MKRLDKNDQTSRSLYKGAGVIKS